MCVCVGATSHFFFSNARRVVRERRRTFVIQDHEDSKGSSVRLGSFLDQNPMIVSCLPWFYLWFSISSFYPSRLIFFFHDQNARKLTVLKLFKSVHNYIDTCSIDDTTLSFICTRVSCTFLIQPERVGSKDEHFFAIFVYILQVLISQRNFSFFLIHDGRKAK